MNVLLVNALIIAGICLVVALIAFRLAWGLPTWNAAMRYLPKNWQRWLLGETRPTQKLH